MLAKMSGPIIVSIITLIGFTMISFLAMKPATAGVDEKVMLFLLGAWSSLATMAVAYWLGSSAGSKNKDEVIATMEKKQP